MRCAYRNPSSHPHLWPIIVSAPEAYPAPLDRLHALGLDETEQPAGVDYRALGIGPDDVPALIRIATDPPTTPRYSPLRGRPFMPGAR